MHHQSKVMYISRVVQSILWISVCLTLAWGGSALAAFNAQLQGLNNGTTNWFQGPLVNWAELQDVPCRVKFTGGPATGRVITVDFDHFKGSVPGIQNLLNFSATPNVVITAGPTLSAPVGSAIWHYTFTVDVTDANQGEVYFFARLSAGAHGIPGGSMNVSGSPSLGNLGIKTPINVTGSPDLSLVKTGPTSANPAQVLNYSVRWQLAKPGDDATGVQVTDTLPGVVTLLSATGNPTVIGNTLTWDLGNLRAGAKGQFTYSVVLTNTAVNGSTFQNSALIASAQDDLTPANNSSAVTTTVTGGCIPPTIAAHPDGQTNCPGSSATFVVVANGSNTLLYQWRKGGVDLAGATNSTLTLNPVALGDAGNYSVLVSNACGSVTSSNATLTVVAPPSCTVSGADNMCPAATGLIYTDTTDAINPTFSWSIGGNGAIVGATTNATVSVTAGASGTFTLNCTVTSETGCSTTCSKIVTINSAPVANADVFDTDEDTPLNILASGVLANDTDADSDVLTLAVLSTVAHGALTLNADGSFSYTPAANFNGADSFTYTITDTCSHSATGTVNLTVNTVNDVPVVVNQTPNVDEDMVLNVVAPGALTGASDADSDPLTAILVAGPAHGLLIFNPDGSYNYTPDANYHGTDGFTFAATDGVATSAVATVTITVNSVNDTPTVVGQTPSVDEDTPLSVSALGVLTGAADADGDSITALLISGPTHGLLTLNPDGSYSYTPAADYNGTDSFSFAATDGTATSTPATVTITVNAVNDAPVVVDQTPNTSEDTPLIVAAPGALTGASDVDGDPITAVLITGPLHGTLILNPDGSYSYTPDANYAGSDSFSFAATDGTLTSTPATVTITIASVSDAPVANVDSYDTDEDTPLNVAAAGVLTNDTDVEGDPLSAVLVSIPAHGTIVLNGDGSFTYTPDADFTGTDAFTYRAFDGTLKSNDATVTITVNAVNDAPVANNDSFSTPEETPLTVAAPGVLANDTDVDGDAITVAVVSDPAHGALTMNTDGSFTYTPEANFAGADTFTYQASDGALDSAAATVTINVSNINDVPVAVADDYTTAEDTALNVAAPGVLANDTDADGNLLTVVLVTGPTHGTLVLNADGSFDYTPAADFNGTDSFVYHANDGLADSSDQVVTITISGANDAPVARDDSYSTPEDTALNVTASGILANDTDTEGDPLTAVLVTDAAHGTLALSADGSFTYAPDAGYNGADSFTYVANDGTADSGPATVNILVSSVNDAPVANNDSYGTAEETTLNVAAPGVLANDVDPDGDLLSAALVSGPAHGMLTFNADGSFDYTPDVDYNGADSFTYKVSDGTADSADAIVFIAVGAVNDAPVVVDQTPDVDEDTPLSVTAPGVLTGASDADGDPLTAILITGPTHGLLTFNPDGSYDYTPNANYNGTDSFTFAATDGVATSAVATVTITVNAVNDTPTVMNQTPSVDEDTPLNVAGPGVLTGANDPDGDPLTAVLVTPPANGTAVVNPDGSYNYTPNANYNGTDCFSFAATDGTATSDPATVCVTVNAVNDPPVVVNQTPDGTEDTPFNGAAPGVLTGASDPENDPLTAILISPPANGTVDLNPDGSYTYTPNENYNGTDCFSFAATDGVATSAVATVCINVAAVNDAPVANADSYSTNRNTPLNVAATGVLGNDTDAESDPLTAALVSGPAHGTLTLNADGSFDYTPADGYYGDDSFTYQANDGSADSNTATVSITVKFMNTAPVATDDSYEVAEDDVLTVDAPGVLDNDTDADDDPLTAVLVDGPGHGTLTLNADGSFEYVPEDNYNGTDEFTYLVNDGTEDSAPATVSLDVKSVTGAGDVDLFTRHVMVRIDWAAHNAENHAGDSFHMRGRINPRGITNDLSSATVSIMVNGVELIPPQTLGADGMFESDPSAVPQLRYRLNAATGFYRFWIDGIDLRAIAGFDNADETGYKTLTIRLAINGAELELPSVSGQAELRYTSVADQYTWGWFNYRIHRMITGAFKMSHTIVQQTTPGTYVIDASGPMETEGGNLIVLAGDITIKLGDSTIVVPVGTLSPMLIEGWATNLVYTSTLGAVPELSSFVIHNRTHRFHVITAPLTDTGIPAADVIAPLVHRLPVLFIVPTTVGTNYFESIVELKRLDDVSTDWER